MSFFGLKHLIKGTELGICDGSQTETVCGLLLSARLWESAIASRPWKVLGGSLFNFKCRKCFKRKHEDSLSRTVSNK